MQIERVSKQDRIYKFEHRIEHGPQESIVVWRWNLAGDFGYKSAVYYVPCGTHIKKGLHNMRRPTPCRADKSGWRERPIRIRPGCWDVATGKLR